MGGALKTPMNLLRQPISHLRSSSYGCTAAVLDATLAGSLRFLGVFSPSK